MGGEYRENMERRIWTSTVENIGGEWRIWTSTKMVGENIGENMDIHE
jgi:hypothetical protein